MVRAKRAFAGLMAAGMIAVLIGGAGCSLLKPKKKGQFSEACQDNTDCESLQCSSYGNICTKDCTYDKDCGGDLVCRSKDEGSGEACAKSIGNAPNGGCMNATECANGHCLKRIGQEDQLGICSKFCASGDDCPAGMKICESISDTGLLKMCLPGDPAAPPAERPKFNPVPPKPKTTTTTTATTPTRPVVTTTATTPATATPTATATATASTKPTTSTTASNPIFKKPPPPPPKKPH